MGHSIVFFILPASGGLLVFNYLLRKLRPEAIQKVFGHLFWLILSVWMLSAYAIALGFSLYFPATLDFVESTVASISYIASYGKPLYVGLLDPDRYSLLYGPLCYIPYSIAIKVLGANLGSLKAALFLLTISTFITLWFLLRSLLKRTETLVAMAFVASAFMMESNAMFMVRGDITLALSITVALLATSIRTTWFAGFLFSLAAACAVDIKITAVFYLLVPGYLLLRNSRFPVWIASLGLSIVWAFIPFAFPNISLRLYLSWLYEASRHPLGLGTFVMNVYTAALVLLLPVLMLWRFHLSDPARSKKFVQDRRGLLICFAVGICGTLWSGSKLGAGRYHFNPTFILSAYLSALLWKQPTEVPVRVSRLFTQLFAVVALFFVVPASGELLGMRSLCFERMAYAEQVNTDLDSILREHPHQTIEMGYSENIRHGEPISGLTSFRTKLVFAGNPLTVDPSALFDMQLSGIQIPKSTVAVMRSCKVKIWLFPRGGIPFSTLNPYALVAPSKFPDRHLFTSDFQSVFRSEYHKSGESRFYDLWACQ